jgi:hypothetical protein
MFSISVQMDLSNVGFCELSGFINLLAARPHYRNTWVIREINAIAQVHYPHITFKWPLI